MDRDERKEQIIAAIKSQQGLLSLAAKKVGVTYWTIWKYAQDFPEVKEAVKEAKEATLDFAEGRLLEMMRDGNIAAVIFYLKTQGKGRGYIERSEITGAEGTPLLNVNVGSNETKEDIEDVLRRLSLN